MTTFQVGQRVHVRFPPDYLVEALIVEDRGMRGPQPRRIWRVRYFFGSDCECEIPEDWMTATVKDCSTCAHASTSKQKKVIEATGFGDQMMFEDEDKDETVYACAAPAGPYAGKGLGTTPVSCGSWKEPVKYSSRLAELDARIAQFEARNKLGANE